MNTISLPKLSYKVPRGNGYIELLFESSQTVKILNERRVKTSARTTETFLDLENNSTVIIRKSARKDVPGGVDGVLKEAGDGLRWVAHEKFISLTRQIKSIEWTGIKAGISNSWKDRFSFRTSFQKEDGSEIPGLRKPQIGALYSIGSHFTMSDRVATIVMPTGTGKTEVMLSTIVSFRPETTLIVVPNVALRDQTFKKACSLGLLHKLMLLDDEGRLPVCGLIKSTPQNDTHLQIFKESNIIVSTIDALRNSPILKEVASMVDLLIIDEAHHIGALGWEKFRNVFSKVKVLQFTATPFRNDSKLVDGQLIFQYSLQEAQKDKYFKSIQFIPVFEIENSSEDVELAQAGIARLKQDLDHGYDHILMARCISKSKAQEVFEIYRTLAPDLNPILIFSGVSEIKERTQKLRNRNSRVLVCVNMFGEGFDLPQLKVAVLHDRHKSLAITLQFIGRFTRTAEANLGDATVVANVADGYYHKKLELLYKEDSDWNTLLSEFSSEATKRHKRLLEFLNKSKRLDSEAVTDVEISKRLLKPTFSSIFFNAEDFNPQSFTRDFGSKESIKASWLTTDEKTLFFVSQRNLPLKWTRSKELRNNEWHLHVLHFIRELKIIFYISSDKKNLPLQMLEAVGAGGQIKGDVLFKAFGHLNRLVLSNVGLRKHGRKNLSFAMYTGSDVRTALTESEKVTASKSNISGSGWEEGNLETVGASIKGRAWSMATGTIPELIDWCNKIGSKIRDESITTEEILRNVIIPREVEQFPSSLPISIEWPVELLKVSDEKVKIQVDDKKVRLIECELKILPSDVLGRSFKFSIQIDGTPEFHVLELALDDTQGYVVRVKDDKKSNLIVGTRPQDLCEFLSDYPPVVRFSDGIEIDGNLSLAIDNYQVPTIPEHLVVPWDWNAIDITKESIWKGGTERRDSVQWATFQRPTIQNCDIVFDDDGSGEAADIVCLSEKKNVIEVVLYHCKYSGGMSTGQRIKDVVEVSTQAVRSNKWKWKFDDLCKHLVYRENQRFSKGRTRLLKGEIKTIENLRKIFNNKPVSMKIAIVQPGFSKSNPSSDQLQVLSAAAAYLKETIDCDLEIYCST